MFGIWDRQHSENYFLWNSLLELLSERSLFMTFQFSALKQQQVSLMMELLSDKSLFMAFQFCTPKKQLLFKFNLLLVMDFPLRSSSNMNVFETKGHVLEKDLKRCLNRKSRYPWKLLNSMPNISMRKVSVKRKGVRVERIDNQIYGLLQFGEVHGNGAKRSLEKEHKREENPVCQCYTLDEERHSVAQTSACRTVGNSDV